MKLLYNTNISSIGGDMLKGYAINQKRLEYLGKTVKLIDIANRIDERLEGNNAKEFLQKINLKGNKRI